MRCTWSLMSHCSVETATRSGWYDILCIILRRLRNQVVLKHWSLRCEMDVQCLLHNKFLPSAGFIYHWGFLPQLAVVPQSHKPHPHAKRERERIEFLVTFKLFWILLFMWHDVNDVVMITAPQRKLAKMDESFLLVIKLLIAMPLQ